MTHASPLANGLWRDWLDWAQSQGLSIPEGPDFDAARARVWEGSEYVATQVARHPEVWAELLASGDLERPYTAGELAARLPPPGADEDEPGLHARLRQFRRREMIRIVWRDLSAAATLDETLEDLSALADVAIGHALDLLAAWTRGALGTPCDDQGRPLGLVVLGMGKLGARELNLSSDVDLIFAFPRTGEVQGGPRPLRNEEFFVRLAQRLVQALGNVTADGFVFRVDTRLRPFGESGPLAMSFGAMEYYYQSQARPWERYAMIKARVVAGDSTDGAALMAMLHAFVYRRYLDFSVIESLRELKHLIAKELHRHGMESNIKLGPGGIREIEFIGQVFQLIRGGRDPDLRCRPIREVLRQLAVKDLLPAAAIERLDTAYCFLRRTENRLQAWRDQQTHRLPGEGDPGGRARLARAMGFDTWDGFVAVLDQHRDQVQSQFDQVFALPHAGPAPRPETGLAPLWPDPPADAAALLAAAGFQEPDATAGYLGEFHARIARKGLSSRGAERLARLMPLVFDIAAAAEQPDSALARILIVLESIALRSAYVAMLIEHPIILSQLARLASRSPWFTERIGRHPLLLDELIDPRRLYAPLRRDELEQELDALLLTVDGEDLEQQMERLHQFAQGNTLRVAAADLTGGIPLMVVSDYLTEIAEVAVGRVLTLAFGHLRRRHGRPTHILGEDSGFLVVGYGKFGGLELGYGSDLDLVFIHGAESVGSATDGERELSNEQFYARLGQRIIHMLTTRTASGALYEIDMRLRPDGNQGLLTRSLKSFAQYQDTAAWTWEHQALTRARPVAGDRLLAQRFNEVRRATLCRPRDPDQLRQDVREMRARMRAQLDRSGADAFDLKQGAGGIADIEFMVQYAVLRWAAEHPEVAAWPDNIRQLETLGRLGLLPPGAAEDLTAAYKALRGAYHRSALQTRPTLAAASELQAERQQVRAYWAALLEEPAPP